MTTRTASLERGSRAVDEGEILPQLSYRPLVTYRKASPPPPERDRRKQVVRMADPPEELERNEKHEIARVVRAESAAIAAALEEERRRFDRHVRAAGGVLTLVGLGLTTMAPLTDRGAALAGFALLTGTASLVLGGQGGTRPETMPTWTGWALAVAGFIGGLLGLATLR